MGKEVHFHAVIFDMDGTLVDNMAFHTRALVEVTKRRLGIHLVAEQVERDFAGLKSSEVIEIIAGRRLDATEKEKWAREKEAVYRTLYGPHLNPVQGAREFLIRLRGAGVRLAIASAAPEENRAFILDGLALRSQFDQIIGQEDAARGKPAPDLFLTAAARLEVDPARCLVFEDAVNGLVGARAAGMESVGLTTVCRQAELLKAGARWTIPDFLTLPGDLEYLLFG